MTILIDLDETVLDLLTPWRADMKYYHGIDLNIEDITEYSILNCIRNKYKDIKPSVIEACLNLINKEGFFDKLKMFPKAKENIDKLHIENHKIVFVTNGQFASNSMKSKLKFVEDNFPYADLIITGNSKSHIYGDIVIDDNPKCLKDIKANYKLLISRKYNEQCGEFVKVYHNKDTYLWDTIYDMITRWINEQKYYTNILK